MNNKQLIENHAKANGLTLKLYDENLGQYTHEQLQPLLDSITNRLGDVQLCEHGVVEVVINANNELYLNLMYKGFYDYNYVAKRPLFSIKGKY